MAAHPHQGSSWSSFAEVISALIKNMIRKMIRDAVFFCEF
jgi:hypothetical protein